MKIQDINVLGKKMSNVVREHTACANKNSEGEIVKILYFLIDNIIVEFGGEFFNKQLAFQLAHIVRPY